ncbi:hypothetical protein [Roseburia inulinivorans]|jgi:hypothetical protein|uniref:hypothetical protein n=1 Tax=Roseburia inulinivorans TaxID=360807 RepID=UPI00205D9A7C|nr:MAG TPA: hypothetical protein [Bacteriophage sp.]DAM36175.1 MAG TPA: hypothetical protein [Caudoviricetes sp.]DAQ54896.1 MAG TPA: hypothetical protein [Caudoviricetes sp.]DAV93325.1 MAG TPA: hypothetical protein [Caudoviricetes sp.]DAW42763.1 MAG TPA: hypothetical protein [Caudoviricetes sp.]
MAEKLITKNDLLNKLRAYRTTPDDENIQYKKKIEKALMLNPCLLYALNEKSLESELFDDDGNINWEWNEETKEYEPLGEWDRYFGGTSNIRPYLFIPDTQTEVKHYICYQVSFDEMPRYQDTLKYTNVTFTIFVHGNDRNDKLTGIPRHDLIASIIRERFNWSNIFGMQTHLVSSKESTTDNNYIVRTLVFQVVDTNGIVKTTNGITSTNNYQLRR